MIRRRSRLLGALVSWLIPPALLSIAPAAVGFDAEVVRQTDIAEVSGIQLSRLYGTQVSRLGLYRYEPSSNGYVPIPFQLDERIDRAFNPGTEQEFTERMYDVLGEDDGLLDNLDELVFVFGDAGSRAPADAIWPPGADITGYEIEVIDPRQGASAPVRWAYLFAGDALEPSPDVYVSWDGASGSAISTDQFMIGYQDRWLLTEYAVLGCGDGMDLIDRLKARAGISTNQAETEEVWNQASVYLGGIVGPVRAIRYVRGAASGFNTIHHDTVTAGRWTRSFHLRVHPLNAIWHYIDWLPQPGLELFSPSRRTGVPQDGMPDAANPYGPLEPWQLLSGPGGGMFFSYLFQLSPYYGSVESYLRDDSSYDDAPITPPGYGDEDDSAYANHGFRMNALTGSEVEAITWYHTLRPVCANEGDASVGDALWQLERMRLETETFAHGQTTGPIETLGTRIDGDDVVLDWLAVVGATSYRIYRSVDPSIPQGSWPLVGEVTDPNFRDAGVAGLGDLYYSVVASGVP